MEKQPVSELIVMIDYASAKVSEHSAKVSQLETGRVSNYIIDMQAHETKITDAKLTLNSWKVYVERLRELIEERIKDTTNL